jgi:hypothetical protein
MRDQLANRLSKSDASKSEMADGAYPDAGGKGGGGGGVGGGCLC